ncbi:type VI secretion system protein TssA [Metapseudomonas otitidis]|uniref:type VI secretion system protein TssA n=1 Tax=Metapseudomonas otitidis TaxID=319939 RepID=UPI001CA3FFBB|nr:type VI secretion system protein TssA [Pseudomonas otitidis]QZX80712.1 type VI secretion system protein TssA [Pseudomonas otitidis]
MVDVSHLLSPVSAESPCGDDLEYDASYLELERIAQGQPERQMGDSVLPAEPPAWRDVRELSSQLLGRSKDLRIANYFLQSAIALEGLAGLAQSLTLVRELLAQFWDGVYPQLDADDDNDPTFRINALTGLASEPVIRLVREANLTSSRAFGAVTLRAALNALDLQRFPSETLTAEQLQGAFRDTDPALLESTRQALTDAQSALAAIESTLSDQVGSAQSADLAPLKQLIRQALQIVKEHAPLDDSAPAEDAATDGGDGSAGESPVAVTSAPRAAPHEINNRDDVLRTLDRILAYYERQEPSSPVPMLLKRARKLVTADFAEIVRNLIPDGMSQFENLRGPESE